MATLVTFHAHPDDEAIATGGVMARAAAEGHRVVLVVATRGELGEVPDGFLGDGETLSERRVQETLAAADILGVARVEFLGYHDSGMDGEPTNHAPGAFGAADVEQAAKRLARLLEEEAADVLTVYDERGTYGHPDHVQVHHVGVRAAELAGTPRVYEATVNRDYLLDLMEQRRGDLPPEVELPDSDVVQLGVDGHRITTTVDVHGYLAQKRAAMAAHASQISEDSFFLAMPDDAFALTFGHEWFIRHGERPAAPETWLLDE